MCKLLLLIQVLAFAVAPSSSFLLMSRHTSPAHAAQVIQAKPCPMHAALAQDKVSHADTGEAAPAAFPDPDCYCGLFCHAAIASVEAPRSLAEPVGAVVTPATLPLMQGLWPKPLPRPPQA